MVATSENTPPVSASPAKTPRPRPKGLGGSLPMTAKLRARTLYVVQGLTPAQIAPKVKLTPEQVQDLASRSGWPKERFEVMRNLTEAEIARAKSDVQNVVDHFGHMSEDGAMAGLQRAVECTTKKSKFAAKDYASWANGARALVSIARQARGLEDKSFTKGGGDTHNTINMFVGRFGPAVSEASVPKNVTPAKAALEAGCVTVATSAARGET